MKKIGWSTDLSGAQAIWVRKGKDEWVWSKDKSIESHDPADRVGGPYRISAFIDEGSSGEHFFIFAVVDSYFPAYDLVRADTFEDAYEIYVDWAAEHRGIAIEEPDLKDYDEGQLHYTSDGVPVDDESITGGEVQFVKADGVEDESEEENPVANNPRRGPGKFDSDLDAVLYSMSLDGTDEDFSGEGFGSYSLLVDITREDLERAAKDAGEELTEEDIEDGEGASAILFERTDGIVEVELYDSEEDARKEWAKVEKAYEKFMEEVEGGG